MPTLRHFPLVLVILAAGTLAGCVHDQVAANPVAAAAVPPAAASTADQPKPVQPMTDQEASAECWMHYEHGRRDLPLDTRADLVDKCIAAKMKSQASR